MTAIESLPGVWDPDRDEVFFRLVADVFSPSFTTGASVLLVSNDDEPSGRAPQPALTAVAG